MSVWTKLETGGQPFDINRKGEVRQKEIILAGKKFLNFTRVPSYNRQGYMYLAFKINGKQKNCFIHRLVALTFIPNPDNKPFVNHKDGNKQNNKVSNLEWVTASENNKHAFETGLKVIPKGEDNHLSILTNDQVREIKIRIINGQKQRDIAKIYNVHYSLISHIKAGRKWGHVEI